MIVQTIERAGKPEYVVIAWEDYQTLLEAAEDAMDRAAIDSFKLRRAAGEEEWVPADTANRILDGESPVKVWREYRGMTQEALAERAGISKAYLCQIETGKRIGAVKTLRAIAVALGVAVEDL